MSELERARLDALEEAARECDASARRITSLIASGGGAIRSVVLAGSVQVCQELAAGIRALGAATPKTDDRAPQLGWCEHCGEGVTDFCRGKMAYCPKGLRLIKRNAHGAQHAASESDVA